ncbi:MAG: hypothetical protein QGF53_14095 [Alphaproteobacteria bacterium]|nr:hypothetical protein [Alphaproteobacteria bacterium]
MATGLPDAEALVRELGAFQRAFTKAGHATFDGVDEHDDLVIAVALGCWRSTRQMVDTLSNVLDVAPK